MCGASRRGLSPTFILFVVLRPSNDHTVLVIPFSCWYVRQKLHFTDRYVRLIDPTCCETRSAASYSQDGILNRHMWERIGIIERDLLVDQSIPLNTILPSEVYDITRTDDYVFEATTSILGLTQNDGRFNSLCTVVALKGFSRRARLQIRSQTSHF